MTRDLWLGLSLFIAVCAVAAGWFAMNAPEASRPRFADLGPVVLPEANPPMPPAPLARRDAAGYETLLRRPLFASGDRGPQPRRGLGDRGALPAGAVGFSAVLAPLATAPQADLKPMKTDRAPRELFQAGFGIPRPSHSQFFGGHLLPDAVRLSDPEPPPKRETAPALAPAPATPLDLSGSSGGAPLPRPRPGSTTIETPVREEVAAQEPSAIAAPTLESEAAAGGGEVDIIVLGVLLGRGQDRALVRTPDGENRRVSLGDLIAGWRVAAIGEDFVRLRRASQTRELKVPQ